MSGENSAEMPKYRCHKEVQALKIEKIEYYGDAGAVLTFEDKIYAPIEVSSGWTGKHEPEVGGYYVLYSNGHKSYSPAEAFETGYTPIDGNETSASNEVTVPRNLLKRLTKWLHCMSYNDSYFTEPAGELKRVTGELNRLV